MLLRHKCTTEEYTYLHNIASLDPYVYTLEIITTLKTSENISLHLLLMLPFPLSYSSSGINLFYNRFSLYFLRILHKWNHKLCTHLSDILKSNLIIFRITHVVYFFLLLHGIPLYGYATVDLLIFTG